MHTASRSGVFALLLLLVGGCSSDGEGGGGSQAGSGTPCEEDADCGKGERCNTSIDQPVC